MVEVFQRHVDSKMWLYQQFRSGQEIEFTSIDFTIPMAALYWLTGIPEQEPEEE
jgi:hypothetical protein